jgi:hypothetical protein
MKWFPDTQLKLDGPDYPYSKVELAKLRDLDGGEPPTPGSLLPLRRPRSRLESGVEEWRQPRLQTIDEQLALRNGHQFALATYTHVFRTSMSANEVQYHSVNSHRALRVTELLGAMLRPLDPKSQYKCRNVSRCW